MTTTSIRRPGSGKYGDRSPGLPNHKRYTAPKGGSLFQPLRCPKGPLFHGGSSLLIRVNDGARRPHGSAFNLLRSTRSIVDQDGLQGDWNGASADGVSSVVQVPVSAVGDSASSWSRRDRPGRIRDRAGAAGTCPIVVPNDQAKLAIGKDELAGPDGG
jgi:hypothetical protein